MGVIRIMVNNLTRITHSRAFVIVVVVSTLIIPLFVYDNASISKNVSDNYYMGSIYPLDSIPLSHSECFLLLGNNMSEIHRENVEFNMTISFLLKLPSVINKTATISSHTWTEDYNVTSTDTGIVVINNTDLSSMLMHLEIKQRGNVFFPSNASILITGYTLNSYKLINESKLQTDTFFSFNSVSVQAHGKNFTVYFANMPSSVLGNYGTTEIFYSRNAPSTGYNVSLTNPKGVFIGPSHINFVIFRMHIKNGEVLSITDKSQLLSLNSEGKTTIYIDDTGISIDLEKRAGGNSLDPDSLSSISGSAAIFVSSLFVIVGISPGLNRETRKRYLLLPPKRRTILLANMASTIFLASLVVSVIFFLWTSYSFLITGNFYNILTYIYTLITVVLLIFAESSIYLMASYFRKKSIRFYLDISFLGLIPVLFMAVYGYIYYNATTIFSSLPVNSINFLVEPLRASFSFYNKIMSLAPVFSPVQLNNLLVSTPVLGIKMPGMGSTFGLDFYIIMLGSIGLPLCILFIGLFLLRKSSEEAE